MPEMLRQRKYCYSYDDVICIRWILDKITKRGFDYYEKKIFSYINCCSCNFYAFRMNSECPDYERVYAAYYFDYMLNYDLYKNVNTVNIINDETCLQYDFILTATQKQEFLDPNYEYISENCIERRWHD